MNAPLLIVEGGSRNLWRIFPDGRVAEVEAVK